MASEACAAAPAISRLMAGNHGEEKARKTLMHTSGKGLQASRARMSTFGNSPQAKSHRR
jgi:hypothetical protein